MQQYEYEAKICEFWHRWTAKCLMQNWFDAEQNTIEAAIDQCARPSEIMCEC